MDEMICGEDNAEDYHPKGLYHREEKSEDQSGWTSQTNSLILIQNQDP